MSQSIQHSKPSHCFKDKLFKLFFGYFVKFIFFYRLNASEFTYILILHISVKDTTISLKHIFFYSVRFIFCKINSLLLDMTPNSSAFVLYYFKNLSLLH